MKSVVSCHDFVNIYESKPSSTTHLRLFIASSQLCSGVGTIEFQTNTDVDIALAAKLLGERAKFMIMVAQPIVCLLMSYSKSRLSLHHYAVSQFRQLIGLRKHVA